MVTQRHDGSMEFRFFRPDARQVTLAGDFNGWQENCLTMSKSDDGWWQCRLGLAPGCYQFRYLADGQWYTDYAAFGIEKCPYGWNSVVQVETVQPRPVVKPSIRPERPIFTRDAGRMAAVSEVDDHPRHSERGQREIRVPALAS